mmetsp:Transcript_14532/g.27354  ORF Transcript_14532/g.27354 Transcript_14532/m.27354 type:complete len:95 (+) Transcript_14532:318-602(+)
MMKCAGAATTGRNYTTNNHFGAIASLGIIYINLNSVTLSESAQVRNRSSTGRRKAPAGAVTTCLGWRHEVCFVHVSPISRMLHPRCNMKIISST